MRAVYNFTFAIIMLLGLALTAPAANATPPDMEDFFERPDFFDLAMSPNGQYLAFVKREGDEQFIVSIDLDAKGGDMKSVPIGKVVANDLDWVTNERLLINTSGYIGRRTGKNISREKIRDMWEDGKDIWRTVRLENQSIVMNRDGKNPVTMFEDSALRKKDFFRAQLVSTLPTDDNYIIMQAEYADIRDVRGSFASFEAPVHLYKVRLSNGDEKRIEAGIKDTDSWLVDRNGEAVMRWDTKDTGLIVHAHAKRDGRWEKVKEIPAFSFSNNAGEAFRPLAPAADSSKYWALARPDGERQINLYLYDVTTGQYGDPVISKPGVDISNAFIGQETGELVGVEFSGKKPTIVFEDPEIDAHIQGLAQYYGSDALIEIVAGSSDTNRLLLRVTYPDKGSTYYLYDTEKRSPMSLGSPRSSLKGKSLATMQIVDYTARDGMELFGYLSRPAGIDPKKKMPLVMFVHGGPEARDDYGFDTIVQILVANGYQVFQPQFRGSTGQGQDYAEAGYRQWGKKMQSDVDDAFEHLIQQGLVDRDKACLMGFSYGGYAAFAAATLTPNTYQCILAGAGVSDLIEMQEWENRKWHSSHPLPKYWNTHIGNIQTDREDLIAHSPARHADKITRPMIIFHGEDDDVVPIEQSRIMMAAMDRAGKPYEWHKMEMTGHSYGNNPTRIMETLGKAVAFLNKHLPPAR